MTKLSKGQLLADRNAAQSMRARTIKRAEVAGLIKPNRRHQRLPANLDPDLAIAQRRKMHAAMTYFEAAFLAGKPVMHLTWCPQDFYVKPGELTGKLILTFGKVASRRARNLAYERRRVIGAIDIMFNYELGLWCVHLHALIAIRGLSEKEAKAEVKKAFGPGKVKRPELAQLKFRKAPFINDEQHLQRVFSYLSGATVLVDHNGEQRRDRRLRVRDSSSKFSQKAMLSGDLDAELTRVYAELGPSRFWVLSGFKRHGGGVAPEPALHKSERRATAALAERCGGPKLRTVSAISRAKPLF